MCSALLSAVEAGLKKMAGNLFQVHAFLQPQSAFCLNKLAGKTDQGKVYWGTAASVESRGVAESLPEVSLATW